MRPIRRILVAVKDPWAKTLPAVAKAAQLAKALGSHLELFHALSTPLYIDVYGMDESISRMVHRMRRQSLQQLESIADNLRRQGLSVSASATWDFPIYEAIIRRAARESVDLIVAENHARAHVLPGVLRLTDWELLRNSPIPVLLVKTSAPYRHPVILAAVDPGHSLAKPASLDGEILQLAKHLSASLHGPLHAVHGYVPYPVQPPHRLLTEAAVTKMINQTKRAAMRALQSSVKDTRIPKNQCHLIPRHPIDAVTQTSKRIRSSIVVLGAVSRSGLRGFFFGNTAEALLDCLNCDMLVVKPAGFAPRVARRGRGVRFAASSYAPVA